MDEREYEAAYDAVQRLAEWPYVVGRLGFNGAPDDLCVRADAVLRLAVRVLDDVGVFTEIEAVEVLVKQWATTNKKGGAG
jgi:hypothetical protein